MIIKYTHMIASGRAYVSFDEEDAVEEIRRRLVRKGLEEAVAQGRWKRSLPPHAGSLRHVRQWSPKVRRQR